MLNLCVILYQLHSGGKHFRLILCGFSTGCTGQSLCSCGSGRHPVGGIRHNGNSGLDFGPQMCPVCAGQSAPKVLSPSCRLVSLRHHLQWTPFCVLHPRLVVSAFVFMYITHAPVLFCRCACCRGHQLRCAVAGTACLRLGLSPGVSQPASAYARTSHGDRYSRRYSRRIYSVNNSTGNVYAGGAVAVPDRHPDFHDERTDHALGRRAERGEHHEFATGRGTLLQLFIAF